MRLLKICWCLMTLAPVVAHASAYTMPKGEGRVIVDAFWSTSDKAFDDHGHAFDIANYNKIEVYALTEYGLTDDLTLILTPSFRNVSIKGSGNDSSGLGYTDVGARFRVIRGNGWVFSLQGLARIPGTKRRDNFAQIGSTNSEFDFRAQAGIDLGKGPAPSFLIVDGGYRLRSGEPADEFHADVTLGLRAAPKLLLLAQSQNTISNGSGRGVFRRGNYHNAYVSGVYDVSQSVSLQIGAVATVAGENALRERGLFSGIWFRF